MQQYYPDRPALTAMCERILLLFLRKNSLAASARPLCTVPRRLLAVKVHGMGDSVMVRSLLEHFHRRHSSVEIGVLAGSANRDVLTTGSSSFHLHHYDQRNVSPAAILRTLRDIRRRRYEAVIDFEQGSLAGAAFVRAAGIPVRAGFLPLNSDAKAAFLTHPVQFREQDSMWVSFIRLMRIIDQDFPKGIPTMPLPVDNQTRRSMREWMRAKASGPIDNVIVLHLGSAQKRPYRRWPVQRFIALAERLRMQSPNLLIVLTGRPFERSLIQEFVAGYTGPAVDATGLNPITRVAALLAECDLLVSNDTGIMHLGAAMRAPTVGIFGSASPRRWAPVGPYATAVSAEWVSCSPCAETYRLCDPSDCMNPDRIRCLQEVSVDMVLEAIRRVTSERPRLRSCQPASALR
jgi:ADP-heptose:LPS heptosyltransferase